VGWTGLAALPLPEQAQSSWRLFDVPAAESAALPGWSAHAYPALQEALKDAESAVKERAALLSKVRELQAKLEEETSARSTLKDKVQRKLASAEQEVRLSDPRAGPRLVWAFRGRG